MWNNKKKYSKLFNTIPLLFDFVWNMGKRRRRRAGSLRDIALLRVSNIMYAEPSPPPSLHLAPARKLLGEVSSVERPLVGTRRQAQCQHHHQHHQDHGPLHLGGTWLDDAGKGKCLSPAEETKNKKTFANNWCTEIFESRNGG